MTAYEGCGKIQGHMISKLQINFIIYACLFASGMATLVYELIWFRYLALIFGANLYALSAVLCAFMLGLACGAWVIGRIIARVGVSKRLILWYGLFIFMMLYTITDLMDRNRWNWLLELVKLLLIMTISFFEQSWIW